MRMVTSPLFPLQGDHEDVLPSSILHLSLCLSHQPPEAHPGNAMVTPDRQSGEGYLLCFLSSSSNSHPQSLPALQKATCCSLSFLSAPTLRRTMHIFSSSLPLPPKPFISPTVKALALWKPTGGNHLPPSCPPVLTTDSSSAW